MRRTAALGAVTAACALAGALPPTAAADTYRGRTSQGRAVSLTTAADGSPERVAISWRARCRNGRFVSRTVFVPPFDAAAPETFDATGLSRMRLKGGYRARVRVAAGGTRDDEGTWIGDFRATVTVFRGHKRIDVCRLRRDPWSARPAD